MLILHLNDDNDNMVNDNDNVVNNNDDDDDNDKDDDDDYIDDGYDDDDDNKAINNQFSENSFLVKNFLKCLVSNRLKWLQYYFSFVFVQGGWVMLR